MATGTTLYDFQIALSHVDRGVEQALAFKVARHPSETMQRLWLRVLAYCWLWDERLGFGAGLDDGEAPDLEERDCSGVLTQWARVGKADPARVQRVIDRNGAARVSVLFESPGRMAAFLEEAVQHKLTRLARGQFAAVEPELLAALAADESRRSKLAVTLVGDHFYVDRGGATVDGPLTRGAL